MASLFDTRRYLTDFDSVKTANVLTDTLVVGTGVAGARAAIEAAQYGLVTVVTKSDFDESCTRYAQGGIAAAMAPDDSPEKHLEDTIRVGCWLNRREAVQRLVNEAPRCIRELMEWGFQPDLSAGQPALTTEGGHSISRIIHAQGDQTGRELARTLHQRVSETEQVRVFDHCYLIDLITVEGACVGAVTFHEKYGHQIIWAKQTVLASGGCGRIWRETTNPGVATGDGMAAAYRAGARLCDMEMMQFHPTTLYVAGAARALISEAVRGEGAYLVDRSGERFMDDYHPDAELAPRDIVSRAIHDHLQKTRASSVYLDVRHIKGFKERFPQVSGLCANFEIDVSRDGIPVRPSAHYMIGGVDVALDGTSTIDGLLCCGEAACTGVHGANRIASNSLLEGLVFGKLVGETAGRRAVEMRDSVQVHRTKSENPHSTRTVLDLPDIRNSLRSVMWRNVGIVRHEDRLGETCEILDFWAHYALDKTFDDVMGWEAQNELTVARLIVGSALERKDSIGVHFRTDGEHKKAVSLYHLSVTRSEEGTTPQRVEVT